MILRSEITRIAQQAGVRLTTIEKDCVLGHLKAEMTWHELLCFSNVLLPLNNDYSDSERFGGVTVPCYHLFEIIAEKLRATIQRGYPPFDLVITELKEILSIYFA